MLEEKPEYKKGPQGPFRFFTLSPRERDGVRASGRTPVRDQSLSDALSVTEER